jgi:hypothetical protein
MGFGARLSSARLQQAWKLLLKNHPHDSICGVSIDDVHTDMETRLTESSAAAEDMIDEALFTLAANINTQRDPAAQRCWVVVNTSLQKHSRIVALPSDLPDDITIHDSAGRKFLTQRAANAMLVRVPEVPALGYRAIFASRHTSLLEAGPGDLSIAAAVVDLERRTIANEFVRVLINGNGTIDVTDKGTQTTYTEIAALEDGGDAGDTYNYSDPDFDQIITSRDRFARSILWRWVRFVLAPKSRQVCKSRPRSHRMASIAARTRASFPSLHGSRSRRIRRSFSSILKSATLHAITESAASSLLTCAPTIRTPKRNSMWLRAQSR